MAQVLWTQWQPLRKLQSQHILKKWWASMISWHCWKSLGLCLQHFINHYANRFQLHQFSEQEPCDCCHSCAWQYPAISEVVRLLRTFLIHISSNKMSLITLTIIRINYYCLHDFALMIEIQQTQNHTILQTMRRCAKLGTFYYTRIKLKTFRKFHWLAS